MIWFDSAPWPSFCTPLINARLALARHHGNGLEKAHRVHVLVAWEETRGGGGSLVSLREQAHVFQMEFTWRVLKRKQTRPQKSSRRRLFLFRAVSKRRSSGPIPCNFSFASSRNTPLTSANPSPSVLTSGPNRVLSACVFWALCERPRHVFGPHPARLSRTDRPISFVLDTLPGILDRR